MRDGAIEFVDIVSRLGETCRLRNPWGAPCTLAFGAETTDFDADLICFDTVADSSYRLRPKGRPEPTVRRIAPAPATGPGSCSFRLPHAVVLLYLLMIVRPALWRVWTKTKV